MFGWRLILRKSLLYWLYESLWGGEVRRRTVLIKKTSPKLRLPAAWRATCGAEQQSKMLRATEATAGCSHRAQPREWTPHRLAPSPKAAGRGPGSPPQAAGQGLAVPPPPGGEVAPGGPRRRRRWAAGGGGPPRRAAVLRSPAPGGRRHDGERARGRERGGGRGGRLPLGGQEQRLHRLGCGRVWGVVGRSARSACGLPGDICEIACDTPAPFCFTLVGGLDNGYAFYWEMQCLSNIIWSQKCSGRARLGCSWKISPSFPCSYLLLQYGFINTCLKSLVVEKYGEEIWEKLR